MRRRVRPPCRRRSTASRDRARDARRRSHPRIRRGVHRQTGEADRRRHASRSCPSGCRPGHRPPMRSAPRHRRVHDRRAAPASEVTREPCYSSFSRRSKQGRSGLRSDSPSGFHIRTPSTSSNPMTPNIESAFKGSNAEVHLGNAGPLVGEDADDVGSALDLALKPLRRVGIRYEDVGAAVPGLIYHARSGRGPASRQDRPPQVRRRRRRLRTWLICRGIGAACGSLRPWHYLRTKSDVGA